ncbi:kinase-like domain-containing protein [Phascolomyces articulosus]|uniref:Kinase-like domain-containing protein n=1 Tax=Phascolomyces articulosus TaxID=60185 RepID=A0AAD5JLU1_9FUNG|nr:kinase-like domain-containing protein [Phascolomyces articulosus]
MAVDTEATTPLQRMVSTTQSNPYSHNNNNNIKEPIGIPLDIPTCSTEIDLITLKGEALEHAVIKLLRILFPGLVSPHQKIHMERVTIALTNAIYFVTIGKQKLLLRVYGLGCEDLIDRKNELQWLARLSKLKLCPRLLAIFGNGRFEEYLPSTTLLPHDIRNPLISQQLAPRIRELHSIVDIYPPPLPASGEDKLSITVWQQNVDRWYHTLQSIDNIPERVNMEKLGHEIDLAKSMLSKSNSPIVFGHGDTQYGNILRLTGTNDLVLVDFEYSGYNPRGLDLVNHFCEWMYDYQSETLSDQMQWEFFPSVEKRRNFLSAYIDTAKYLNEENINVDMLLQESSDWILGNHIYWALWGMVQATRSNIDYDYWAYSFYRLDAFRKELESRK